MVLPSCIKFAEERGEIVSQAIWSEFETLVVHKISLQECDITIISKIYSNIVYYANCSYCIAPLLKNVVFLNKTTDQIRSKVNHVSAREKLFNSVRPL